MRLGHAGVLLVVVVGVMRCGSADDDVNDVHSHEPSRDSGVDRVSLAMDGHPPDAFDAETDDAADAFVDAPPVEAGECPSPPDICCCGGDVVADPICKDGVYTCPEYYDALDPQDCIDSCYLPLPIDAGDAF